MPKFGRKPPKNAPALRLAAFLSGTIPDHPASADSIAFGGWNMLGNDQYGDCVAVMQANDRRVLSRLAGHETYWTLDQVLAFYKTQNPNFPADDNGMDMQTALEYLLAHGGPDGVKPVAFAKVDHTNLEEVNAAIAIFGVVQLGVNVQAANQTDFAQGKLWDYHAHSPIEGGHAVAGGGYSDGTVRFITWGKETGFTVGFWTHLVEECWAVIWPEHLGTAQFLAGIDQAKLAAAYKAITGNDLPTVTPPQPPVADPDAAFASALRPYIKAHPKARISGPAQTWLTARGL